MAEPLTPEREAIIRQQQPGDWLTGAWMIRETQVDGVDVWQVLNGKTVLATLPDWAGNLALWIAETHEDVPELLVEIDRLRKELEQVSSEIARFGIYGSPVPAAKALVKRADELVTENAELKRPAIEAERSEIRQSFMELSAQTREDRDYEGAFNVDCNLRDREQQWAREDAAARGRARLDAKTVADAEATHWRRLGIAPEGGAS